MFHLIRFLIWLAGIAVVAYFVLLHFGYEVNMDYFTQSKEACQAKVTACSKELVEQGTKNAKCNLDCVNPKLIIKKQ